MNSDDNDQWLNYHCNQFSPKLREFAKAQYRHLRDQTARPLPEDYGLEPREVSDLIIRLSQIRPAPKPISS
jgi:hypothetical protein